MPLLHAFTRQTDAWSPRQRQHLSAISKFNFTFKHLPGKKNPVADALPRTEINAVQLGLEYDHLASEQQQDPEASATRNSITSLQWRDVPLNDSGTIILCDMSTGRPCPRIPASLRHHILNLVHNLSHPSCQASTRLITQKFIWPASLATWEIGCGPASPARSPKYTDTPRLAQDLSTNQRDVLPTST
ncbi:hypothetical protein Pcinc_006941 [Petrolisthes cinctipes]|uniref:Integrase zinc-binding domain-containing protein n=1 Tax=Petrolisthes cinctipes TaxID=88211 RepID=A0AAE1GC13_PETCI|nr:hypothetical protein Pcinc_006941 [Petrolisthes cinctipes]